MIKTDIIAGLKQLNLPPGAGLMVHSSLRSFGYVEGGAQTVIEALMETVTTQGTLMMPSFNHGAAFQNGTPGYFDPKATPTVNGAIPDLFWRLPGVYRSLNPTHAIAVWGRNALRYTQFHHRTLTFGLQSPLGLLYQDGGYGLLLGVDFSANSFHHVVETSIKAPCLGYRSEAYPVRLPGDEIVMGRTWSWRERRCPFSDRTTYADIMANHGLNHTAKIGRCKAIIFRLQDCYDILSDLLQSGKDEIPGCSGCSIRPRRSSHTVASDWDHQTQHLHPDSHTWGY